MDRSKPKMNALIDQFCSITGADRDTGQGLLEACAGNLELAVNMHMEGGGAGASGASPVPDDTVRAPIPQTEEMLVEDISPYAVSFRGKKRKNRSVFDGFRDFQEEARQQEEELQARASGSKTSKKTKTLQDLFRPPIDITYKGTFYHARDTGKSQGKWLMVNIQNVQEFACQALNRDVWSNSAVKALIKDNFIFWQVYHDSDEGQKYCQFYHVTEWPYVAVLDPQTGENLITWSKIEPLTFCDLVSEFLATHPTSDSMSPPAKRVRTQSDSIVDATEDDQLQAAIRASLTDVTQKSKPAETITYESDTDNEMQSDLETFSDTDQSFAGSPANSRRSPSSTPERRRSPRRNSVNSSSGSADQTTSSHRRPGSRCESPLVSDNVSAKKSKHSSPQKAQSPQPGGSNTRKASPKRSKSSPQRSQSPKKVPSIHNEVHPAVVQNLRNSVEDQKLPKEDLSTATKAHSEVKQSESEPSDTSLNDSVQSISIDSRDYTTYLGKDTDENITLMLRLPDGNREKLCIPFSSKLMAVVLFVGSKGFSNERYELVAHFPNRQLSQLDFESTLRAIGLNSQETIFVQART